MSADVAEAKRLENVRNLVRIAAEFRKAGSKFDHPPEFRIWKPAPGVTHDAVFAAYTDYLLTDSHRRYRLLKNKRLSVLDHGEDRELSEVSDGKSVFDDSLIAMVDRQFHGISPEFMRPGFLLIFAEPHTLAKAGEDFKRLAAEAMAFVSDEFLEVCSPINALFVQWCELLTEQYISYRRYPPLLLARRGIVNVFEVSADLCEKIAREMQDSPDCQQSKEQSQIDDLGPVLPRRRYAEAIGKDDRWLKTRIEQMDLVRMKRKTPRSRKCQLSKSDLCNVAEMKMQDLERRLQEVALAESDKKHCK